MDQGRWAMPSGSGDSSWCAEEDLTDEPCFDSRVGRPVPPRLGASPARPCGKAWGRGSFSPNSSCCSGGASCFSVGSSMSRRVPVARRPLHPATCVIQVQPEVDATRSHFKYRLQAVLAAGAAAAGSDAAPQPPASTPPSRPSSAPSSRPGSAPAARRPPPVSPGGFPGPLAGPAKPATAPQGGPRPKHKWSAGTCRPGMPAGFGGGRPPSARGPRMCQPPCQPPPVRSTAGSSPPEVLFPLLQRQLVPMPRPTRRPEESRAQPRATPPRGPGCREAFAAAPPPCTTPCGLCAICLEPLPCAENSSAQLGNSSQALVCGHVFHLECIQQWIMASPTCPLCKHIVEEDAAEV